MKYIQPPLDVLQNVIPLHVREKWRSNPTEELLQRLNILCACGPIPWDERKAMYMLSNRARRVAWETYVFCAYACGFFEGSKGKDLRARLADSGTKNFRSAISECMACWFLAGRMHLPIIGDAPGRKKKNLDMQTIIKGQKVGVEVKAPYQEPSSPVWKENDGNLISSSLKSANEQFSDDVPNILLLIPRLRIPLSQDRSQIVSALYVKEYITGKIDSQTGSSAGPITTKLFPEGSFLRRRQPSGALIKRNGLPGFTRVSTVIVIEENPIWISKKICLVDHDILVAHNPHARYPINSELFCEYIQFIELDNRNWGWNDGEPLH